MEISIYEAKSNFSKIIQCLIDEKEEVIVITKNSKPVVQMTLISKRNSKRIGAAEKEMEGFDISLEDFNNIPLDVDFGI